jgi:hypothetical protein
MQQLNAVEISLLPEGFRHPSNKERGRLHNSASHSTWLVELCNHVKEKYPSFKCGSGSLNFRIYEDRLILVPAHQRCGVEVGFVQAFTETRKDAHKALQARLEREENTIRNFTGMIFEEVRSYDYAKYNGVLNTWTGVKYTLYVFKNGATVSVEVLESETVSGNLPDTAEMQRKFDEFKGAKLQTYYKHTGALANEPRGWSINRPFILSHERGNVLLTELLKES